MNSHDTAKMHIQDTALAGINRGAAKDRLSLAVADHCGEVAAGNVYRSSSFAVFLSFLVLTG